MNYMFQKDLLKDSGPAGTEPFHRVIGGTGVQHHDLVSLGHGVHPAVGKLTFILTDGIDRDLQRITLL